MTSNNLTRLNAEHHAAIRLKIGGARPEQIAEELSVKLRTVHLWFSSDKVKEEYRRQLQQVNELFAEKLVENAMVGLDLLRDMAEQGDIPHLDPDTRIEVIKEMLDRNPVTRVPSVAGADGNGGGNTFNMLFANMTDEELKAALARMGQRVLGGGNGTAS